MAYYYLAKLKNRRYLEQAIRYAGGASQKEQAYISVLQASADRDIDRVVTELQQLIEKYPDEKEALRQLAQYVAYRGDHLEAAGYLERSIEIDPLYKASYDFLAVCHDKLGNFEKALQAIDRYIELAPDEANPYDTKANILARNGRLDEAIQSWTAAVGIKRDFAKYRALLSLGQMHVFRGNYDTANVIFQELASGEDKAARSRARTNMALVLMRQGKLDAAMALLDDGITADRLEQATSGASGDRAIKHFQKAFLAREKGDRTLAVEQMGKALEINNQAYPDNWYAYRYLQVQVLAEAGQFEEAEQVAESFRVKLETSAHGMSDYQYAMGCIRLAQGEVNKATSYLSQAVDENSSFYAQYMLGRALMQENRASEATAVLEAALLDYTGFRYSFVIWSTKSHYYLGMAYEQTDQIQQAAEQFETFVKWGCAGCGEFATLVTSSGVT
jgi:tetratricopeptide (TPR) repeat protein